MQSDVPQAEYQFEVSLVDTFRAQNTLLASVGATLDDRETWTQTLYAWASDAARRQWVNDGSQANIQATFQMARESGLQPDELIGWRLNGDVGSLGNSSVQQAVNVTYEQGRFGQGAMVTDTSRLSWAAALPEQFHVSFWFIPKQVSTCVMWRASQDSGALLQVGYDAERAVFFLEDERYEGVQLSYPINARDRVCIAVSQSAKERVLFVGKMGAEALSGAAPLAPVGGYSTVSLY